MDYNFKELQAKAVREIKVAEENIGNLKANVAIGAALTYAILALALAVKDSNK
ncbi:MAG: hypothetical protein HYW78_00665 [Parcubacteria group bacterium]|nr:hypothetical protein [Parcubacteria group bacterium]